MIVLIERTQMPLWFVCSFLSVCLFSYLFPKQIFRFVISSSLLPQTVYSLFLYLSALKVRSNEGVRNNKLLSNFRHKIHIKARAEIDFLCVMFSIMKKISTYSKKQSPKSCRTQETYQSLQKQGEEHCENKTEHTQNIINRLQDHLRFAPWKNGWEKILHSRNGKIFQNGESFRIIILLLNSQPRIMQF